MARPFKIASVLILLGCALYLTGQCQNGLLLSHTVSQSSNNTNNTVHLRTADDVERLFDRVQQQYQQQRFLRDRIEQATARLVQEERRSSVPPEVERILKILFRREL